MKYILFPVGCSASLLAIKLAGVDPEMAWWFVLSPIWLPIVAILFGIAALYLFWFAVLQFSNLPWRRKR